MKCGFTLIIFQDRRTDFEMWIYPDLWSRFYAHSRRYIYNIYVHIFISFIINSSVDRWKSLCNWTHWLCFIINSLVDRWKSLCNWTHSLCFIINSSVDRWNSLCNWTHWLCFIVNSLVDRWNSLCNWTLQRYPRRRNYNGKIVKLIVKCLSSDQLI